ncbi:MAG: nitrilase-related carbon-nitrogen hydrolase [Bacteroidota bacterium]
MKNLNITLIQTTLFWEDRPKNLDHFRKLIERIPQQSDLILLPEMFNTGYSINPEFCAEPMDGPSMLFLLEMARSSQAAVAATLLIMEEGEYVNRLVFYYPDGTRMTYDKRHLFRLSGEAGIFKGGEERIVIPLKGWKLMPMICYDLRFPVWSKNRMIAGEYEYDLLFYLSNWPIVRSHAWRALLVARAIENLSFVAGVNRIGEDGNGMEHTGDSMVVDPKGLVLYQAPSGEEAVQTITLNYMNLKLFREAFAFGQDWDTFAIH